ncbi:MAG: FkbM family methyltransferase, partial [Pirellula sp.]
MKPCWQERTGAEIHMIGSSERAIYNRLLIAGGTVVEVSPKPSGFIEELRQIKSSWTGHYFSNSQPLAESCARQRIRRLSLLHLHANASDLEVLRSGLAMVQNQRIDVIQFAIGIWPNPTGESLFDIVTFLQSFGYFLIAIDSSGTKSLSRVECTGTNERPPVTVVAVAPRFERIFQSGGTDTDSLLNLRAIFPAHSIQPRGVVHVGAHEAQELELYKELGFQRILCVEANPHLANAIRERTMNDPSVTVASCAVSDSNGSLMLRVTSSDQSSSILPLKLHREYYPKIHETHQISVQTRRLDTLLKELNLSASDFNYLHMDIQGAELMALHGAPGLLQHIEAITSEVNFEELFDGCGLIDDLELHLESQGFDSHPVVISSPFHTSWGDAFYVRPKQPPVSSADRGVLTARTLGRNGRFANQLFQYAFLRILARHHGLRVETSKWVGQLLFGH